MSDRIHLAEAGRPQHPEPHTPERPEYSCYVCLAAVERAGDACAAHAVKP